MIKPTARVEIDNGIKFYEQDVLFDDYIYKGDTDITVTVDYANPGFGIALLDSAGTYLAQKRELLMFKLGVKFVDVYYRNLDDLDSVNNPIQGSLNAAYAKCYTENLEFKISKRDNQYTIYVGGQKIAIYNSQCDLDSFNIAYYSVKDNVIKDIAIASSVPYDWNVNMTNTHGGYIEFNEDGFELKGCKYNAEIEQLNIELEKGTYYLKYNKSDLCDIKPYIMYSNDERIVDDEKNILNSNKTFTLPMDSKVSLKFVGTNGSINDIAITTAKNNSYIQTTPETGDFVKIERSYLEFDLKELSKIEFDAIVNFVPGDTDFSPTEYAIVNISNRHYGLNDLELSVGIKYHFVYENGQLVSSNEVNANKFTLPIDSLKFIMFDNVNAIITNLILTNKDGSQTNIGVQFTTTKSVPGLIKSPIVVLNKHNDPLDLSASFRIVMQNDSPYYIFTNTEREIFKADSLIKLNSLPINNSGAIIIYGIPKDATLDMDKLYYIPKRGKDNIDLCCNIYDVMYEGDEYQVYIDYTTGYVTIRNPEKYKYFIVDYVKLDSYCINYNYEYNSYLVEIATNDKEGINVIYDNTEKKNGSYEYINEQKYYDTKLVPSENCYIVIGR